MRIFDHYKITFVALMACMVFMVSCGDDFLEVEPTGQLAESTLANKAGIEGLLIGAYATLNGEFGNRFEGPNRWVTGGILGGDANKGTDPGDYSTINPIQRYEINPTNGDINNLWRGRYEGISRCNYVLRLLPAAEDITEAEATRIAAEARMLRAHFYFDLKIQFNSIPYIDETLDYGLGIEEVPNSPDIWDKIEADFQFAFDNLPETQAQIGRVNKWAAGAYLGKTYLFQEKWSQAKSMFDQVIANGVTPSGDKYALLDDFAQIYNAENDNHAEAVFAVQSANNTGSTANANYFDDLNYPYNTGSDGPGNCCGFNQPSFSLVNSFRVDANGLPLLDGSYNTAANEVKHDYGLATSDSFEEDNGPLDPRLDHSVGRRGIPYLDWIEHPGNDWIRNQAYAGPFSPKKYIYYRTQENSFTDGSSWTRGYAIMNFTIIRYADVLLMAAEAEAELGNLDQALEYVNMVRERAANEEHWVKEYDGSGNAANYSIGLYTSADFDTQDKALERIYFERKLELNNEGHRFFDLVRWGMANEELNAYLDWEAQYLTTMFGGANYTDTYKWLPIPQTQIDIHPEGVLTQNPGY
ncbi:RagB/SusD family nutrient uptake outer membrane protein [Flavilitoribacter nigricans]|uniref:RagB/SusD family nutrient uptake outer membrane protein n=1 Tax=Flavilitoribacter nigricans (strain ATCC 23147 / DSM 23189 / NBRC 102662 / NCIMB 1420 / SS-2) TaxID=1122177 RepID=A0A2D0NIF1_FLAN2|nr:RagB/SusD family nutrient uptake outer membrane protein [Flavilitoribacter nigricans]PHN07533.1 RagB/SusD family nutrient uptake outer membrane protein [Flavilitoribacter nigricans DSM 23189 = NBRC 102662]